MWRDAWVYSKKKEYIAKIKEWLDRWEYTMDYIFEHIKSASIWLEDKLYLSHEEIISNWKVSKDIQEIIDAWLYIDSVDIVKRKLKMWELKVILEKEYPTLTTDLNQLQSSLIRLERAKIEWEIDIIEAKLNILDIGCIENWYWERKESSVVKILDKFNWVVNRSILPDRFKKYVWGFIQNPNTSAILSALATRAWLSTLAWSAILTWFLAPIAVWSLAWWVLAKGRAQREKRDRNAQINRRWALGLNEIENESGENSSNSINENDGFQISVSELLKKIEGQIVDSENDFEPNDIYTESLTAWISYLFYHRIGREKNLNMLAYDRNSSVSSQHIEIISTLNKKFPWLVNKFNSWELLNDQNVYDEASISKILYNEINIKVSDIIKKRIRHEKIYARNQWLIYSVMAAWVWLSVWAILNLLTVDWGIMSSINSIKQQISTLLSTHTETIIEWSYETIWFKPDYYPDNLTWYSNVDRDFWYNNKTPSKYDYTELIIRNDDSWWWNVSSLINKSPHTNWHIYHDVSWDDFTNNHISAVVSVSKWWPYFVLPIDSSWKILIPESMKSAFDSKSFAYLEVWEVQITADWKVEVSADWSIKINPMSTVRWSSTMDFDKIEWDPIVKFVSNIPLDIPVTDTETNIYLIPPFWVNRYHELSEKSKRVDINKDNNSNNNDWELNNSNWAIS